MCNITFNVFHHHHLNGDFIHSYFCLVFFIYFIMCEYHRTFKTYTHFMSLVTGLFSSYFSSHINFHFFSISNGLMSRNVNNFWSICEKSFLDIFKVILKNSFEAFLNCWMIKASQSLNSSIKFPPVSSSLRDFTIKFILKVH